MMELIRYLLGKPAWLVKASTEVVKAIGEGRTEDAERLAHKASLQRRLDLAALAASKMKP